ncbi:hypothetical protein [Pseudomonas oryziphila]|uniref:hypothetical protein n=1 Tax=Pseudomonas oryziphila TaxID=2894079 RepID=UPI001CB8F62B|nr:hypothetical protein [Pseudomonas oryziphila]
MAFDKPSDKHIAFALDFAPCRGGDVWRDLGDFACSHSHIYQWLGVVNAYFSKDKVHQLQSS